MKKTSIILLTTLMSMLSFTGCKQEVSSSTSSTSSNVTSVNTTNTITTSSTSNIVTYQMLVTAVNGNHLKNVTVKIYNGSTLLETLTTDFYGKVEITLEREIYTAKLSNLPSGMYSSEDVFTLKEGEVNNLVCYANPIDESIPAGHQYNVDDLMYDFAFYNTKSKKVKLSSLLEGKKGVVLNFWGTTCVPCKEEFPHFEQLHQNYVDEVTVVALSVEDGLRGVSDFVTDNEYTFTFGADLNRGIFKAFLRYFGDVQSGSYSIPDTVFIDKYGFINSMHKGSFPTYESLENDCVELINKYNSEVKA